MADDTAPRARRSRRTTATSAFGASRREGHDASAFYARFRTPDLSDDETLADPSAVETIRNRIFVGDSRNMSEIPDGSVGLVVTSPPYFAGKAYEESLGEGHIPADYVEYLDMLGDVFDECRRVLEPGGRMVVNVANLGRRPFRSLAADVIGILQDDLGLLLRGEIVWLKQRGSSGSCAWGSYRSATNPVLRDTTERLVVASKGRFDRAQSVAKRAKIGRPSVSTIPADEFLEATLDVWEIPPESATRVNHPAPFPVALVERCLQLYSFAGDLVLDPFMGSGSTAVAARRLGRDFVGYDMDEQYVELAMSRVATEGQPVSTSEVRTMHDVVDDLLKSVGGLTVEWGVRLSPALEISGRIVTSDGRRFLFDLAGGNTTVRPGLVRGDLIWRTIGRAAAAHALSGERVIVFSTGAPERSGATVFDAVERNGAVVGVVDPIDPHALDALERLL